PPVARAPPLPDADVVAERELLAAEARQLADDMFRYPFQLAFSAAFADAGYGLPIGALRETLAGLTGADARGWHQHTLAAARRVVIAVGDVGSQHAAEVLAGVFE